MKRIIIILTLFLVVGLITYGIMSWNKKSSQDNSIDQASAESSHSGQKKIKVATCPTYSDKIKGVIPGKFKIIETGSTAESITLLESKQVEMALAGRTLKPSEPRMGHIVAGKGYSFLSANGGVVYKDELSNRDIYTDLEPEALKDIFPVQGIEQVDNVYGYLDKGIVITSWENTDYTKAEIVHLLERNGERVELSRRPTIYCPGSCGGQAEELASLLK
jgi:hypothetical protein